MAKPGTDVVVHVVPVEVLQFLRSEVYPRHLVVVVVGSLESVPVVEGKVAASLLGPVAHDLHVPLVG